MGKLSDTLNVGESYEKDEDYFILIDFHVDFLKKHPRTSVMSVTPSEASMFKGDLYGLLNLKQVRKKFHFLVARMNDIDQPTMYDGKQTDFLVPEISVVNQILSTYTSYESN